MPALFGAFLIPLAYLIIRQLGYSQLSATIAAVCFLFDSALVTGSRFVLTDSINLGVLLTATFSVIKFAQKRPLSCSSYAWGLLAGLFMGLSISAKYTAFNTLLLLGWIVVRHYWRTLDAMSINAADLWRYLVVCGLVVVCIPVGVYLACFAGHLKWLTKAGPYDAMMSTRFQSSLEVGFLEIVFFFQCNCIEIVRYFFPVVWQWSVVVWSIDWLVGCSINWLNECYIVWLFDWLIAYWCVQLQNRLSIRGGSVFQWQQVASFIIGVGVFRPVSRIGFYDTVTRYSSDIYFRGFCFR